MKFYIRACSKLKFKVDRSTKKQTLSLSLSLSFYLHYFLFFYNLLSPFQGGSSSSNLSFFLKPNSITTLLLTPYPPPLSATFSMEPKSHSRSLTGIVLCECLIFPPPFSPPNLEFSKPQTLVFLDLSVFSLLSLPLSISLLF